MKTTPYGEPRPVQKLKLWRARWRPRPLQARRCKLGKHNPPPDRFFLKQGAVFVGGRCRRCDDPALRPMCFLGNAWDFPGCADITRTETGTHFQLKWRILHRTLLDLGYRVFI